MALTTKISLSVIATLTKALDLPTNTSPLAYPVIYDWDSGTGLDQADKVYQDHFSISASSEQLYDLAGSLEDAFGDVLTFARVKALYISADTGNTNDVMVGNAAANGWGGTGTPWNAVTNANRIRPGGSLLLVANSATAYPVTAGSADILRIFNSGAGTSVDGDLIIIGASA